MICVPQLCGNEDILPSEHSGHERCLQRYTNRRLIVIPFSAIEVSKSNFQGILRSLRGREKARDQRAEPDGRDHA